LKRIIFENIFFKASTFQPFKRQTAQKPDALRNLFGVSDFPSKPSLFMHFGVQLEKDHFCQHFSQSISFSAVSRDKQFKNLML
jgi:hypothetical protein